MTDLLIARSTVRRPQRAGPICLSAASPRESLSLPIPGLICTHQSDGEHQAMTENLTDTSNTDQSDGATKFWPSIVPPVAPPPPKKKSGKSGRKKGTAMQGVFPRLSRNNVFEVVVELHAAGRTVTRHAISEALGVPIARFEDHLKFLYHDGALRRVSPGVYEPLDTYAPARPVSITKLPDGVVKVEVGDVCLDLTPPECRAIASMLMGTAFDYSLINSTRDLADQITELRANGQAQKQRIAKLVEMMEAGLTGARKARARKSPPPT